MLCENVQYYSGNMKQLIIVCYCWDTRTGMQHRDTGTETDRYRHRAGHRCRGRLPKHVIIWDTAQGQRQGQDTGAGTGCQSMSSYDIFNISITISISISIYNLQQGHTDRGRGTVTKGQGRGHWDRDRLPMHAIMSVACIIFISLQDKGLYVFNWPISV